MENVEELDYAKAAEIIEGIQKSTHGIEINLKDAISNRLDIEEYGYEKAADMLGKAELKVEAQRPLVQQAVPQFNKEPGVEKEVLEATKEIKDIVGSAGREFEKTVKKEVKNIKGGKLILPSLSLQDQISDLEKMSEGIDEHVFTDDQINMIRYEVNGLSDKIKFEKVPSNDEFQMSLIALRNQKLAEVLKKVSF
ncbi:MAG: hypothetical protein ACP5RF_02015 [Candidatus Micrarchaeia archaeon]